MLYDLLKHPFYILLHPIEGYSDMKREGKGKLYVASFFIAIMCIYSVVSFNALGVIVNSKNPSDFNSIKQILFVLVPIGLFTVGNWAVTTLFDGKGTLKNIYMMLGYALFPFILLSFPNMIFSNVITIEEAGFYYMIHYLAIFLSGYMLFFGMINIHEYSVKKTVITTLMTIVAIGIIIFLFLLFFTLIQQFAQFIYAIYRELALRYF
ncbi:MAG: Yip1 family protein [Candidatus Izemoplasmataceae bacterium]